MSLGRWNTQPLADDRRLAGCRTPQQLLSHCKQIRRRYRGRLPQPPTTQSTTAPPRMSVRGANCDGTTVEMPLTAATVSSFSPSSAVFNVDGKSFSSISAPGSSGRLTGVGRSTRAAVTASSAVCLHSM